MRFCATHSMMGYRGRPVEKLSEPPTYQDR
jgi:hypothetical protein